MKLKRFLFFSLIILNACSKKIYSVYESSPQDKSASLRIDLKPNHRVERTEIHTIRIDQQGTWIKKEGKIICYFEENAQGFSKDTLALKIRGQKLFVYRNGVPDRKHYLKRR